MQKVNPFAAWGIGTELYEQAESVEAKLKQGAAWARVEQIRSFNQLKVLKAFQDARISEAGFGGSSGYGYDDLGRERLEEAFAQIMGCEKALLRVQISSGTQAIALGFYGYLRPGDLLISATGLPYDTLFTAIGLDEEGNVQRSGRGHGSLADFGVDFLAIPLLKNGKPDLDTLKEVLAKEQDRCALVFIQRSRGYSDRPALLAEDIREICRTTKRVDEQIVVFVDNCYGEFTDTEEPTQWGADLVAGSLIKNPGGGLAPSGGYICGKAELVEQAAARLTVPGLGAEVGPSLGFNRLLTQGLYQAPHVVAECLHGLSFTAALFESFGIMTEPASDEQRGDIIQVLNLGTAEALIRFCQGVQAASPVDAFVRPQASALPGYSHEVIMAAGAFIQGSSIELSADGPLKAPYRAFLQGGLNYEQVKLAALLAVNGENDL